MAGERIAFKENSNVKLIRQHVTSIKYMRVSPSATKFEVRVLETMVSPPRINKPVFTTGTASEATTMAKSSFFLHSNL